MHFPVFLAEHPCLALALAIIMAVSLLFSSRSVLKRYHLLQRIPVPRPESRILGHFNAFSNAQHHLKLRKWALRCGPVYRIRLIYSPVVILTDPLAVATILRSGSGAEKPDQVYRTGDMFNSDCGQPNLVSDKTASARWRGIRKGISPAFSSSSLRQGFPRLSHVTTDLINVLDTMSGAGAPVDVTDLMMRASFDAVAQLGFHHHFGMVSAILQPSKAVPNQIMISFEEMMHEVPKRAANPFRHLAFWDKGVQEANRATLHFQSVILNLYHTLRAAETLPNHTLGGLLLSLNDPENPEMPLPRPRLLSELSNMFVAGADTTGHTMSWALYLVSLHPATEERVVSELHDLGLAGAEARPVEFADLGRLRYLNAVVKETLRIMPVSAEGTAVKLDTDFDACGYTIPAGTLIWMPFYILHRNPQFWDDPDSFRPERWLNSDAEESPKRAPIYCPFSQGPRSCAGQTMAEMNYKTILASIWGRYILSPVHEADISPEEALKTGVIRLTLQPEHGIEMACRPRI